MKNVHHLMNIFAEIETTSSKNEKEALIKERANVEGFKEILQFVYNPYIVTGLAKKKISKKLSNTISCYIDFDLFELMEYVKINNSGSDAVIAFVQGCLLQLPDEERKFVESILIKDLKVGITSKTINKALGKNFIPEYSVMLAEKWEKHEAKIKGKFQCSLKLDGIRCTVFNEKTGPKFFSRSGIPIEGLIELEHLFKRLPTGFVYDGELIAVNEAAMTSDDLFRYTQTIVRKDGIKTDMEIVLFDMLSIEEFHDGKSKLQLKDRMAQLMLDVLNFKNDADFEDNADLIKTVPIYYVGEDKDKIYEILDEVTKQGLEGLMVSPVDSYYQTKRVNTLLKVKKFDTADLVIKGFEEHKHGDKLGSLIVNYKGYEVNVGSGFSDAERELFWNKRHELIGTIVEVGYFEESKNQNGGISLRFPTFKRLRPDKTTSSYN